MCSDMKCIDADKVCDGVFDCDKAEDEMSCAGQSCKEGEYQCTKGGCINGTSLCDGVIDCQDESDETPACSKSCA